MVRCAIVAAAALALARPLLVTPARRAAWDARTARAIVVDVTPTAGDPSAAVAEERQGVQLDHHSIDCNRRRYR